MYPVIFPEQQVAADIIRQHGVSHNDYFKLWPDKEYLFNRTESGVVAFGVSHKVGFAYGDPVAPRAEMGALIDQFIKHCRQHRWTPVFYQVSPHYLDLYQQRGLHTFKSSEEAIVDLKAFALTGKAGQNSRTTLNRFQREGITAHFFAPPVPDAIVAQAQAVSDEWLTMDRRERQFVTGRFSEGYVRNTPMVAAINAEGAMLGFVNRIPSYADGMATLDLMRHRVDAPNGTMDFLFLKLFEDSKAHGFDYFSLGPAPIVEVVDREGLSAEEKAYYKLTHHLDAFFSMTGLRRYKAKYATIWEPHYLIYPRTTDLLKLVRALTALSELPENKKPILGKEHRQQAKALTHEAIVEIRKIRAARRTTKQASPSNAPANL